MSDPVSHPDHKHHHQDHEHHDHADGHGHDHDHPHRDTHGGGVIGWLRHTFAHSHAAHERVDATLEGSDRGIWALKVSLIGLGVTALLQLVIVWFSSSTALLADTIHNFGDAATSLPLWAAFVLGKRRPSRRFTYGYGRVEDLAGIIIIAVIFFSACVAGFESVRKLIDPEPVSHLWWVVAAAIIGFLGNEAVAIFRIRVGKEIGSAALVADGQHSRVDGFTSLAVLFGALGVWAGFPILDPVIGLVITIAILFIVRDAARSIVRRLLDGIEPEILAKIEATANHVPGVEGVHRIRARWLGHAVAIDMHIEVDRDESVADSHAVVERVEAALREHVPAFGEATIHVCPVTMGGSVPFPSAAD